MKKFAFMLLAILLSIGSYAQEETTYDVTLHEVNPQNWPSHPHAPALFPSVAFDAQNLFIQSPYVINPAQIIIRDSADNIIYNVYVILPASTYMMILPDEVNALKYKIELIYGDHHLMGYF